MKLSIRMSKTVIRTATTLALASLTASFGCGRSKLDVRHKTDLISTSDMTVSMEAIRFQIAYSMLGSAIWEGADCRTCSVQTEIQTVDGFKLHSTENAYSANPSVSLTLFAKDDSVRALLKGDLVVATSLIKLGCAGPIAASRIVVDLGKPNSTHSSAIGAAPPPGSASYKISTRVAELRGVLAPAAPQPECIIPQ